jgi:hypothetical protein
VAGVDEDEDMKKLCVCENAMNVSSSKTRTRDVSPDRDKPSDAPFDNHSIKHEARGLRNKKSKRQALAKRHTRAIAASMNRELDVARSPRSSARASSTSPDPLDPLILDSPCYKSLACGLPL